MYFIPSSWVSCFFDVSLLVGYFACNWGPAVAFRVFRERERGGGVCFRFVPVEASIASLLRLWVTEP